MDHARQLPPSDRRRLQDPVIDDREPWDEDPEQGEIDFISWLLGRPIDNDDPFDYVWRDWDEAVTQLSCCPGESDCSEPLCNVHGRPATNLRLCHDLG